MVVVCSMMARRSSHVHKWHGHCCGEEKQCDNIPEGDGDCDVQALKAWYTGGL